MIESVDISAFCDLIEELIMAIAGIVTAISGAIAVKMVAGEILMRDRKVAHVDEQAIYDQCQEVSDDINERIGFDSFADRKPYLWGENYISQDELFDLQWQREDGGHY